MNRAHINPPALPSSLGRAEVVEQHSPKCFLPEIGTLHALAVPGAAQTPT